MRSFNGYPLTPEQNDVIDKALTGRSLKVTAYAGAGKTSTLVALASEMKGNGLYLAFNADAATDAKKKFKGLGVDVMTTHGLAFRWFREIYPAAVPKGYTYRGHEVADMFSLGWYSNPDWSKRISPYRLGSLVIEWISKFCNSGDDQIEMHHAPVASVPGNPADMDYMQIKSGRMAFKIVEGRRAVLASYLGIARGLWEIISSNPNKHPISHDIYLKLWSLNAPRLPYDYILLDEAQDTNGAVIAVLNAQQCQRIIVGDSHQQIYGFRGAQDAMRKMHTDQEGTLSTSFRYGESLGMLASDFLKGAKNVDVSVKGFAGNKTVLSLEPLPLADLDAIICRTNESSLMMALELHSAGLVPKLRYNCGKAEFINKLEAIKDLISGPGITDKHPDYAGFNQDTFLDYVESAQGGPDNTLKTMLERFGLEAIREVLDAGARKRSGVIVVTTAHKCKGLEFDRVLLADDFTEDISEFSDAEANLLYVALTRAKKALDVHLCLPLLGLAEPINKRLACDLVWKRKNPPDGHVGAWNDSIVSGDYTIVCVPYKNGSRYSAWVKRENLGAMQSPEEAKGLCNKHASSCLK